MNAPKLSSRHLEAGARAHEAFEFGPWHAQPLSKLNSAELARLDGNPSGPWRNPQKPEGLRERNSLLSHNCQLLHICDEM